MTADVSEGNSGYPKTLMPQVDKMREEFGIKEFVLVGDRGMITQKQVDALRDTDKCGWISALRPGTINKLVLSRHFLLVEPSLWVEIKFPISISLFAA